MSAPFVTVLIDTYNHERFIEQAIGSVLKQDFPLSEAEILVVDDGSTDRTPDLVRRFEPRVRLLQKANGGQASAFNFGIEAAQGEIVAFLDGDDWWASNKLSHVVSEMRSDASIGIVGHGIVIVHRDGRHESETLREGFRFQADSLEGAKLLRRRGAFLGTSRMTIRRDVLRKIGAVPESIAVQADEYLFTIAAALAPARILPESLTYYRYHDSNAFQLSDFDQTKLRHKQTSLTALALAIDQRLQSEGIDRSTREAILKYTRSSAVQLRLMLDGGWSWETAQTEWSLYQVAHPDAPLLHRVFKLAVVLGTALLPPRTFYRLHRKITQSGLYNRMRQHWLPIPEMAHLRKETRTGS